MAKATAYSQKESDKSNERMLSGAQHQNEAKDPLRLTIGAMLPLVIVLLIGSYVFKPLLIAIPIFSILLYLVCRYIYAKNYPGEVVENGVVVQLRTHKNPALRDTMKILPIVPFPIDPINYMLSDKYKPNQHLLISGITGTGKTELMTHLLLRKCKTISQGKKIDLETYPKIVFSFKASDSYLKLPFYVVDTSVELPNPFNMDVEAFVTAFVITFPLSKVTIQPSLIPPALEQLAMQSKSWDDFTRILHRELIETTDYNTRAALTWIQEQSKSLIYATSIKDFTIPREKNIIFDFGALGNKEKMKTFFAELILRQLWNDLQNKRRERTIIAIDEADRLTTNRFEDYHSIMNDMLRRGRSFNGWIWVASHNYIDVVDTARNMFGTQFVFNSGGEADLKALGAIHPMLPWIVEHMPNYTFTDAKFPNKNLFIPLYKITPEAFNPMPESTPTSTQEGQPTPPQSPLPTGPAGPILELQRPSREMEIAARIDYMAECRKILDKGPSYATQIAREILMKYHLEVNAKSVDITKKKVNIALDNLWNNKEYKRILWERTKARGSPVLYYKSGKNISGLHIYMTNEVVSLLERQKNLKILHVATKEEPDRCDVLVGLPNETPAFQYEIETGLSKNLIDLKKRTDLVITTTNQNVIVIVPNSLTKERYQGFVKRYATGRVQLFIYSEYEDRILSELERERGGGAVQT